MCQFDVCGVLELCSDFNFVQNSQRFDIYGKIRRVLIFSACPCSWQKKHPKLGTTTRTGQTKSRKTRIDGQPGEAVSETYLDLLIEFFALLHRDFLHFEHATLLSDLCLQFRHLSLQLLESLPSLFTHSTRRWTSQLIFYNLYFNGPEFVHTFSNNLPAFISFLAP